MRCHACDPLNRDRLADTRSTEGAQRHEELSGADLADLFEGRLLRPFVLGRRVMHGHAAPKVGEEGVRELVCDCEAAAARREAGAYQNPAGDCVDAAVLPLAECLRVDAVPGNARQQIEVEGRTLPPEFEGAVNQRTRTPAHRLVRTRRGAVGRQQRLDARVA